jgi:hypothetical protein
MITEGKIAIVVEDHLRNKPSRCGSFQELISVVRRRVRLSRADLRQSTTRPSEAVWEQRLRNIKCHKRHGNLAGIPGG